MGVLEFIISFWFSEQVKELALELVELKLTFERLSFMLAAFGFRVIVVWGTPLILARDLLMEGRDLLVFFIFSYCYSKLTKLYIIYLFESA